MACVEPCRRQWKYYIILLLRGTIITTTTSITGIIRGYSSSCRVVYYCFLRLIVGHYQFCDASVCHGLTAIYLYCLAYIWPYGTRFFCYRAKSYNIVIARRVFVYVIFHCRTRTCPGRKRLSVYRVWFPLSIAALYASSDGVVPYRSIG